MPLLIIVAVSGIKLARLAEELEKVLLEHGKNKELLSTLEIAPPQIQTEPPIEKTVKPKNPALLRQNNLGVPRQKKVNSRGHPRKFFS